MFNKDRIDDLDRRLSSVTSTVDRLIERMATGNTWALPCRPDPDKAWTYWHTYAMQLQEENAELRKKLDEAKKVLE